MIASANYTIHMTSEQQFKFSILAKAVPIGQILKSQDSVMKALGLNQSEFNELVRLEEIKEKIMSETWTKSRGEESSK